MFLDLSLPLGLILFPVWQDCYGGCTDSTQAFYGLMDEVNKPAYLVFVQMTGILDAWSPMGRLCASARNHIHVGSLAAFKGLLVG